MKKTQYFEVRDQACGASQAVAPPPTDVICESSVAEVDHVPDDPSDSKKRAELNRLLEALESPEMLSLRNLFTMC